MPRVPLVARLLLGALLLSIFPPAPAHAALFFADSLFKPTWQAGEAVIPGFWGPLATAPDGLRERYKETTGGEICPPYTACFAIGYGGERNVQYFDKGRMENNLRIGETYQAGHAPRVTFGALARELLTGQIQIGDHDFAQRSPPAIPLAGDASPATPTYAQLASTAVSVLAPVPPREGGVTLVVDAAGTVADITDGLMPVPVFGTYDADTQHNVLRPFAILRDRAGFATIGNALSEPFVASISVGSILRGAVIQVFACRVLIYTEANPEATRVEMSEVGRQYVAWRYPNGLPVSSADYQPFVGTWSRSGFTFEFTAEGGGPALWCTGYPARTTCDITTATDLNTGLARMFFKRTEGDTAYGMVTVSSASGPLKAGGPMVQFQVLPNHMARLSQGNDDVGILLCGPDFATTAPSEVIATHPCD